MKQSWPNLFISSNKVSKWIYVRRLKFSSCRSKGVSVFSLSKRQKTSRESEGTQREKKRKDDTSEKKRTPSFGWKAIILEQGQEKKQYHHSMHYIHFLQHNKAIKP
jgi:hypothetical protein